MSFSHDSRREGIDRAELEMRHACQFRCPLTVRDAKEFEEQVLSFYMDYQHVLCPNLDMRKMVADDPNYRYGLRLAMFSELRRAFGGDCGYYGAERRAIRGTDGGLPGVIEKWTEYLVRTHVA